MISPTRRSQLRRTLKASVVGFVVFVVGQSAWQYFATAGFTSPLEHDSSRVLLDGVVRGAGLGLFWSVLMLPVFWWLAHRNAGEHAA